MPVHSWKTRFTENARFVRRQVLNCVWNLGQVQVLWMQDLPVPIPFRERFAHCKA